MPMWRVLRSHDEKFAAQTEIARLKALQPAELAAEIMPAFGREGHREVLRGRPINAVMVCNWLMRTHRRGSRALPQLWKPTAQALRLLNDAGLIENRRRAPLGSRAALLRVTRLGQRALANDTVREHLGIPTDRAADAR
jgi:hypothetical protein